MTHANEFDNKLNNLNTEGKQMIAEGNDIIGPQSNFGSFDDESIEEL